MNWPSKNERERFEITGFLAAYSRLRGGRKLEVVRKSEKPDYVVYDKLTGEEFGVELTSVYLDDLSVPTKHMRQGEGLVGIRYDEEALEQYLQRLLSAVIDKVSKARDGYEKSRPLILAVYVNEYISLYLGQNELEQLVRRYETVFNSMAPFVEIVFWNLGSGGVYRIKPEPAILK